MNRTSRIETLTNINCMKATSRNCCGAVLFAEQVCSWFCICFYRAYGVFKDLSPFLQSMVVSSMFGYLLTSNAWWNTRRVLGKCLNNIFLLVFIQDLWMNDRHSVYKTGKRQDMPMAISCWQVWVWLRARVGIYMYILTGQRKHGGVKTRDAGHPCRRMPNLIKARHALDLHASI